MKEEFMECFRTLFKKSADDEKRGVFKNAAVVYDLYDHRVPVFWNRDERFRAEKLQRPD